MRSSLFMFRALTLLCLISSLATAQQKRPFTFEDMMKLKRVGDPQLSPDGKWVLYSAVDVSLEANSKTPHVWLIPSAGGEAKELIADQDADRPRWSPDGKRIAFLSNKSGGGQIWVGDFDSSSGAVSGTHQVTNIASEAGGETWPPDGTRMLFTSDIYPECDGAPAKEAECNAKKIEEVSKSKVKALIFEHLLYRHWNAYREGKRSHIFIVNVGGETNKTANGATYQSDLMRQQAPLDLTPGDFESPVFSLGGQDDYAFSPDGKEVAYASNHEKNPAATTNNDLWLVPASGGEAKNITESNKGSDTTPLYSPDGKYIAYRSQKRGGYESDRFQLMLYDRASGHAKSLTASFDRWVGSITWAPDSKRILFTSEDKGESPIFSVDLDGKIEGVARGFNDDVSVSPDGKMIVFSRNSLKAPVELYTLALDRSFPLMAFQAASCYNLDSKSDSSSEICSASKATRLTHTNDELLKTLSLADIEPFSFEGAAGEHVQGFIVKPPDFDANKKYPLKFLIHGGPQGAWGDDWSFRWNPELFAANGYVVVVVNFHGSTGYGQKFIDAINGNWGGAPYDDLMKGLDYAEQHYSFIDKDRECALGASYGGYMINWILGHTNRFKCLVSHDGMFNDESAWGTTEETWFNNWEFKGTPYDNRELYQKWSPHQYAKNFKTPTLVVHGQRDYRLDVSEGLQLFDTLQMLGVQSKMLYFPDEGHWVLKPQNSQLWYQTVNGWVDQWVGGK